MCEIEKVCVYTALTALKSLDTHRHQSSPLNLKYVSLSACQWPGPCEIIYCNNCHLSLALCQVSDGRTGAVSERWNFCACPLEC